MPKQAPVGIVCVPISYRFQQLPPPNYRTYFGEKVIGLTRRIKSEDLLYMVATCHALPNFSLAIQPGLLCSGLPPLRGLLLLENWSETFFLFVHMLWVFLIRDYPPQLFSSLLDPCELFSPPLLLRYNYVIYFWVYLRLVYESVSLVKYHSFWRPLCSINCSPSKQFELIRLSKESDSVSLQDPGCGRSKHKSKCFIMSITSLIVVDFETWHLFLGEVWLFISRIPLCIHS